MKQVVFESSSLRIACISDTHNDNCREHIPPADVVIHAGDFTDDGTLEELQVAFDWISTLPHKVKVVVAGTFDHKREKIALGEAEPPAGTPPPLLTDSLIYLRPGNHDLGLDRSHPKYLREGVELFTSAKAKECGIHYLDREVKTVAYARTPQGGNLNPIRVYGNPCQPDFLKSSYAFTYLPSPSEGAEDAWTAAPSRSDNIDIWAMHSPPIGRLDYLPLPRLTGCAVQAQKIAEARPLLCVFGHYHYSWGVERVRWRGDSDEVDEAERLQFQERQAFDFSEGGMDHVMERGKETIFVNAAWMTMEKRKVERRNPPFVITLPLPLSASDPATSASS